MLILRIATKNKGRLIQVKSTNKRKGIWYRLASFFASVVAVFVIEKVISNPIEKIIGCLTSNDLFVSKWVYKRIAEGTMVNIPFYLLIMALVVLSLFIFSKSSSTKEEDTNFCNSCKPEKKETCPYLRFKRFFDLKNNYRAIIITMWCAWACFAFVTNYINHNSIRIQNNIEIIAPVINEMELKELRSEFFMIESYDDYYKLTSKIDAIAAENGLRVQK